MNRRAFVAATLTTLCGLAPAACNSPSHRGQIYVLVDLSETWFNRDSAALNKDVLQVVGRGIADFAENAEPPVTIEHRAIGAASLLRQPLCSALYMPSLMGGKSGDKTLIARPKALRRYLVDHCPEQILSRVPEPLTEISATVASVAAEPRKKGVRRFIIVVSDFLEEGPSSDVPLGDLTGDAVLMLYRPLLADQAAPRDLTDRISTWRHAFEGAGAQVTLAPDPSLRASTIFDFLTQTPS